MKKRARAETNPYAPIFIRQIADSMIVMAAALLIVGVDLNDYFKPDDSNQKAVIIIKAQTKLIHSLESRIKKLEKDTHKPT